MEKPIDIHAFLDVARSLLQRGYHGCNEQRTAISRTVQDPSRCPYCGLARRYCQCATGGERSRGCDCRYHRTTTMVVVQDEEGEIIDEEAQARAGTGSHWLCPACGKKEVYFNPFSCPHENLSRFGEVDICDDCDFDWPNIG